MSPADMEDIWGYKGHGRIHRSYTKTVQECVKHLSGSVIGFSPMGTPITPVLKSTQDVHLGELNILIEPFPPTENIKILR
jgi:hypothetical protein